jgi:hypothetical protein
MISCIAIAENIALGRDPNDSATTLCPHGRLAHPLLPLTLAEAGNLPRQLQQVPHITEVDLSLPHPQPCSTWCALSLSALTYFLTLPSVRVFPITLLYPSRTSLCMSVSLRKAIPFHRFPAHRPLPLQDRSHPLLPFHLPPLLPCPNFPMLALDAIRIGSRSELTVLPANWLR